MSSRVKEEVKKVIKTPKKTPRSKRPKTREDVLKIIKKQGFSTDLLEIFYSLDE